MNDRHQQRLEHQQAVSTYLQSMPWTYFATVTFRKPRRDSMAAIRDVDNVLSEFYDRAFWATEKHLNSFLHLHGLIYRSPRWRPYPMPWDVQSKSERVFGRSRVVLPRGEDSVACYCSKYVTKDDSFYDYYGAANWWKHPLTGGL